MRVQRHRSIKQTKTQKIILDTVLELSLSTLSLLQIVQYSSEELLLTGVKQSLQYFTSIVWRA